MFILAAIGSAVGLGNIWRFPYICYTNGGGTFLIPYFIALFTAGIPLMILEFSLGHWTRGSPPEAFRKISKKWEWVGWWATITPFIVATFYVVIIGWSFSYLIYSFDIRWGQQAAAFFAQYIGDTGTPLQLGGINLPVLLSLIVVWYSIFLILYKGVKGIGRAVTFLVPMPMIILIILTIRGLTLPGAMEGISYYLTPDFSKLLNPTIWLSAYAQVFFTLSLAVGVMITYASHLKKQSDINNNAFIISLANAGTSFFAGFAVFSVLGYLAVSNGTTMQNIQGITGPALTFITYPTAIAELPYAPFFGIIFYIALISFGITSAFSMIEPINDTLNHRWNISKAKTTGIMCFFGFFVSLLFATGGGQYLLDIVNNFIANFGMITIGILECILIGWGYNIIRLRKHANKTSDFSIGIWWDYIIKYVLPIILVILLIFSAVSYQKPTNYPWSIIILAGILPITVMIVLSFLLAKTKSKGEIK